MARPVKNRIIQSIPTSEGFVPVGYDNHKEYDRVIMTVDEYETIRLIDYSGENPETCAESMGISRSTVTNIYDSARKKISDALINEKILLIEGGNYDISDENCKIGSIKSDKKITVAVPYRDGEIVQHFGQCDTFKFYHIVHNNLESSEIVSASGYGHGTLVTFLKERKINVLICGGIGAGAQNFLAEDNITFFAGVKGSADQAVSDLLAGSLSYSTNATCENQEHSCNCHR